MAASLNARPVVRIVGGELPRMVDEAEAALIAADLGIYQRGDMIVRPARVFVPVSGGQKAEVTRFKRVSVASMTEAMTLAAQFDKYDVREKKWVRKDCPKAVAETYLDRAQWDLPPLLGVIHAPTLRPDGSILQTPGYDPQTRLIFDPRGAKFPKIPKNPSHDDARGALRRLRDLVKTFPFVGDADRAVAIAAILTALVRMSLDFAPLIGFSAPTAGSGKGLLANLAAMTATGERASVMAQGRKEEETEKRLDAMLMSGASLIQIDNCEAPLTGERLCQILTERSVQARVLGLSRMAEVPTSAVVFATGNNLAIAKDMTRRVLLCRIDPGCERPETRRFTTDLLDVLSKRRGEYVQAALTILRAYRVAGSPVQSEVPLGSFEQWSRTVRDALIWAGEADPVATMEAVRASDPHAEAQRAVLDAWDAVIADDRVTAREVVARAADCSPLRDALMSVAGARGEISTSRLGAWLRGMKDRVVGGRKIADAGLKRGVTLWTLQAVEST